MASIIFIAVEQGAKRDTQANCICRVPVTYKQSGDVTEYRADSCDIERYQLNDEDDFV